MHHVPALELDDAQIFDAIAAAKRPATQVQLGNLRPIIIAAYGEYADAAPEVQNVSSIRLTEKEHKALIHTYNVETAPMTKLRGQLMGRTMVARCPFCGVGESSTLDHYLPKERFPQFATMSGNLIPCCARCNTRKSQLVFDELTDVRLFLHPYFDEIPVSSFVRVHVNILPDVLSLAFKVVRPKGMKLEVFQQLQSHFNVLRLADRYRIMSLDHLRDQHRGLARNYGRKKTRSAFRLSYVSSQVISRKNTV
jgi:hypothetical protein